jgi:hypothetical protein
VRSAPARGNRGDVVIGDLTSLVPATRPLRTEVPWQVPKDQILELLRSKGDSGKADQANSELPDQVDTDQHAELLSKLGIDPKDLTGGLGGGLGGKLGL